LGGRDPVVTQKILDGFNLGFGILFATGITLLLIPSLYMVLEDLHGLGKNWKNGKKPVTLYRKLISD